MLKDTSILLGLKVFNGHLIYNNALENRFMRLPLNEAGDQTAKSLFTLPSSWVQDFTVYHPDAQTGMVYNLSCFPYPLMFTFDYIIPPKFSFRRT